MTVNRTKTTLVRVGWALWCIAPVLIVVAITAAYWQKTSPNRPTAGQLVALGVAALLLGIGTVPAIVRGPPRTPTLSFEGPGVERTGPEGLLRGRPTSSREFGCLLLGIVLALALAGAAVWFIVRFVRWAWNGSLAP